MKTKSISITFWGGGVIWSGGVGNRRKCGQDNTKKKQRLVAVRERQRKREKDIKRYIQLAWSCKLPSVTDCIIDPNFYPSLYLQLLPWDFAVPLPRGDYISPLPDFKFGHGTYFGPGDISRHVFNKGFTMPLPSSGEEPASIHLLSEEASKDIHEQNHSSVQQPPYPKSADTGASSAEISRAGPDTHRCVS